MASLEIFEPGTEARTIEVQGALTIGRAGSNDIALTGDPGVSRQHAVVRILGGGAVQIMDLGSSNGTFVDGAQVVLPVRLRDVALIELGATRMVFHAGEAETVDAGQSGSTDVTMAVHSARLADAAILVCDVRGFSAHSEKLPPNEVAQCIGGWFRDAGKVILSHRGIIDKFIGDAVLAYWDSPRPGCCAAALDTATALERLTENRVWPGVEEPFRIGTALHFGRISIGNIGMRSQRDATILGDAVNTVFRLESVLKSFNARILCSSDFYMPVAPRENFQDLGQVSLKGKSRALRVFGVI